MVISLLIWYVYHVHIALTLQIINYSQNLPKQKPEKTWQNNTEAENLTKHNEYNQNEKSSRYIPETHSVEIYSRLRYNGKVSYNTNDAGSNTIFATIQ